MRFAEYGGHSGPHRDGPANFLYSHGEYLFAHSHRRTNPATKHIDASGLHLLQRHCPATELNNTKIPGRSVDSHEQALTLLASVPLSDEPWQTPG
ncbi:MAG: class II glutamine amidotransferase [Pseudomonadales bacterium]|nr:class II glutamine amidotransferase [Pseudomonadales bacterium]